jgi:hypothetical protein
MKKLLPITCAVIILGLTACQKGKIAKNTPDCVIERIETFDENSSCSDGVKVDLYTYQSADVYVFEPGTCGADMTSEVIDADCNTLGYLGGITGNQQIQGSNFYDNAVFKETVWEK